VNWCGWSSPIPGPLQKQRTTDTLRSAAHGCFSHLGAALRGLCALNYLILIGHIDLLPHMFERVVLPAAVQTELSNSLAPPAVQRWIADFPAWLEIAQKPAVTLSTGIHKGEAAAMLWRQPCTRTCC